MPEGQSKLATSLQPQAMALRLIVAALAMGVLSMVAVSVMLRWGRGPAGAGLEFNILTLMGVVAAPAAVVASRLAPMAMVRIARKHMAAGDYFSKYAGADKSYATSESDALAGLYQTTTIVSAAILEGAAFLNVVAYLLEGSPIALGLAIGLAMGVLAMYPSGQRIASWIEHQLRLIDDERQFAGK